MIKLLIFLPIILFIGIGCSRQEDIRGTFVNDDSEVITIDCNYHVRSSHLSGEPFMPANEDEIKLMSTSLQQDEITLAFMWDSILSPFAKWDPYKDEISIGKDIYTRNSFATCK